jgi:hypothetical protein
MQDSNKDNNGANYEGKPMEHEGFNAQAQSQDTSMLVPESGNDSFFDPEGGTHQEEMCENNSSMIFEDVEGENGASAASRFSTDPGRTGAGPFT